MSKDLMFKLRLDDQDRRRLDALAEHYSAPASTVLRILIKKEFDAMRDVRSLQGFKELGVTAANRTEAVTESAPSPEGRSGARRPSRVGASAALRANSHALAEPTRKPTKSRSRSR